MKFRFNLNVSKRQNTNENPNSKLLKRLIHTFNQFLTPLLIYYKYYKYN